MCSNNLGLSHILAPPVILSYALKVNAVDNATGFPSVLFQALQFDEDTSISLDIVVGPKALSFASRLPSRQGVDSE
jgi:hypothetical protein